MCRIDLTASVIISSGKNEEEAIMREIQDTSTVEKTLNPDGEESSNVADEDQKREHQTDEHQEMDIQMMKQKVLAIKTSQRERVM